MLRRIRDTNSLRTQVIIEPNSSTGRRAITSFDGVRKHACRLYSAISSTYTKSCHPEHEAHLFLESRADLLESKHRTAQKKPVAFTISFGPADQVDICRSSEIKVLDADTLESPSRYVSTCFTGTSVNQTSVLDPSPFNPPPTTNISKNLLVYLLAVAHLLKVAYFKETGPLLREILRSALAARQPRSPPVLSR